VGSVPVIMRCARALPRYEQLILYSYSLCTGTVHGEFGVSLQVTERSALPAIKLSRY
jgi:hypothetical protein